MSPDAQRETLHFTAPAPVLRKRLLAWYGKHKRDLPWRRSRDPYHILVSEFMLQQTRVATAIPYYERFLERFPSCQSLARAAEEEVLTLWAGLGYYSRARNLHRAAKQIVQSGDFPQALGGIRELPGVGEYTAAAVASLAFNEPAAAVDGNVFRVVSRLTAEGGDIGSIRIRSRLRAAAEALLDRSRPGEFNQAMMELGATVCLPRKPLCPACPLAGQCRAFSEGLQRQLPVKLRKEESIHQELTVLLIEREGLVLLRRRSDGGKRLAGFWELPEAAQLPAARHLCTLGEFRHTITRHHFLVTVKQAVLGRAPAGWEWKKTSELGQMPITTISRKALNVKIL